MHVLKKLIIKGWYSNKEWEDRKKAEKTGTLSLECDSELDLASQKEKIF